MASGVYPELDLRRSDRARRRRVRSRGANALVAGVATTPADALDAEVAAAVPGLVSVDPGSGELVIDLRTSEERARRIELVAVDPDAVNQALPVVHVVPRAARDGAKRAFDFMAVTATAPIWGSVLLLLAALVRLTSRGTAFYRHERVGRHGDAIQCWKLRTMVRDADARLAELLASDPDLAREFAENFKLKNDPRVTRVGKFLRRTSLDELPQLLNVFRGEMSLVGPRPITEAEMRRYGRYMPIVLSARPGMTGLWQVSGRSDVSYATRVALDVQYAFGQSFGRDLSILARTAARLVRPSQGGAY